MSQVLLQMIAAAPVELTSWSLMILGFGMTGQMLRMGRSHQA